MVFQEWLRFGLIMDKTYLLWVFWMDFFTSCLCTNWDFPMRWKGLQETFQSHGAFLISLFLKTVINTLGESSLPKTLRNCQRFLGDCRHFKQFPEFWGVLLFVSFRLCLFWVFLGLDIWHINCSLLFHSSFFEKRVDYVMSCPIKAFSLLLLFLGYVQSFLCF